MTPAPELLHAVMDVGGSHVTAARVALDGLRSRVTDRAEADLDPHGSAAAILDAIAGAALALNASATSWTLAFPGPFDYAAGIGRYGGFTKFVHLDGVSVRDELAGRLGVDPTAVGFVNDADAYALGEWEAGAAIGHDRVVCLTLGTGVGSGFLDHGVPVDDGAEVPPEGEVHLLEIDGHPLEDTVSTRAILDRYAAAGGSIGDGVRGVADAARSGEERAVRVLDDAMTELGLAITPWLGSFAASVLVIGGSIARSWDLIQAPLRAAIPTDVALVRSALLDDAPLLGAASMSARV